MRSFRQMAVIAGGMLAVTALSWLYLFRMASDMSECADMVMPGGAPGMTVSWMLAMWSVMMVAMMVPTAAPMTLFYVRFRRGRSATAPTVLPAALFLLGYVIAWTAFSVVATTAQLALERTALMSRSSMRLELPVLGGVVLVVAGLFQFTPWKRACLTRCRSPIGFFMTSWRDGTGGALRMGLHHGLFCMGCCWALMLLLFVLGTMNMLWIAALTLLVLIEKVAPRGDAIARLAGVAMVAAGVWLVVK